MKVRCESCLHEIPPSRINGNLAVCQYCGAMTRVEAGMIDAQPSEEREHKPRQKVPLPEGIEIELVDASEEEQKQGPGGVYRTAPQVCRSIRFSRKWSRTTGFIVIAIGIGYFVLISSDLLGNQSCIDMELSTADLVSNALFFLLMFIATCYFGPAFIFNRTTFDVRDGHLAVSNGPVPWPGNKDFAAGTIDQLFTKSTEIRHEDGISVFYHVYALLNDKREVLLIGRISSEEQAMYIEQCVEEALGTEDRPVRGAIDR